MHARKHAILVPGFAGFDALGRLRYYVGVTQLFNKRGVNAGGALHYFDNFPTASVELRARQLVRFIAKKLDRGEIGRHDEVTLIGHSTGGLDIRAALLELTEENTWTVDGRVFQSRELRHVIHRLVFLSVPHYGTNIADYVSSLEHVARELIGEVGLGLRLNQGLVASARRGLVGPLQGSSSGLLLAILDTLNETDLRSDDKAQATDEREARAELSLWLEHMSEDFDVISDLRSWTNAPRMPARRSGDRPGWKSPAHFDENERITELSRWPRHLRVRSYATRGPTPPPQRLKQLLALALDAREAASPLEQLVREGQALKTLARALPSLLDLPRVVRAGAGSLPLLGALAALALDPSLPYDLAYALCADPHGRFRAPTDSTFCEDHQPFGGSPFGRSELQASDNDGIVNTLSMLWPRDPNDPGRHSAFILEADHADVIGHFAPCPSMLGPGRPPPARPSCDRRFEAYDLLASGAGFDKTKFEQLWNDIFRFAF